MFLPSPLKGGSGMFGKARDEKHSSAEQIGHLAYAVSAR